MAGPNSHPIYIQSFAITTDLSSHQFKFVKLSAERTVVICAAATDIPIGVLQNKPDNSIEKVAEVMVIGKTKLNSDAALTVGNLIGTSSDGQADAKTPGSDTTEFICGQVTLASGAAGERAEAIINCAAPARAA